MTELCAVTYSDVRGSNRCRMNMNITGGGPIESLSYDDPDISLICRADLLIDGECAAAPMIARLYEQYGDSFVKNLRGTFAIILYDHKLKALKAWTDHFGAERLVFTNSPGFFAISTDLRLLLP